MAKQIPSKYDSYEFDDEKEEMLAKAFNPYNLMYLKNLRTAAMEEKVNLKLDPDHPKDFIQNEAALAGRINVLNLLIDGDK